MASNPLLTKFAGYGDNFKSDVLAPPANRQLEIYKARAINMSGGSINVAIVRKLANTSSAWKFWQVIAANTPDANDVTTAIQAGTATNIFTTVNNDGYLIQSPDLFNIIGLQVSTAESGSPVYTYQYFNGTSYVTLTPIAVPATYAAATNVVAFQAPVDWTTGSTAAVGGDLSGSYSILVRATTAGGQAVVASRAGSLPSVWLGQFVEYQEGVADNGSLTFETFYDSPIVFDGGESLAAYFSGSASAQNAVAVEYSISG